jgi:hypothetical protein
MAKPKLPARIREALAKNNWQEYVSTTSVASYRRPTELILISPSATHKNRYAIVIDYTDDRPSVNNGVDTDTLIKYLTNDNPS